MFKKILQYKFITGVILLAIIIAFYFGYQWLFNNKNTTRYATAQVQKGTLVIAVSGSGQVSTSDQIDIKPKVSGEIQSIYVNEGGAVYDNQLLIELDPQDAQNNVIKAKSNLESAQFALTKLETSKADAEADLAKADDDIFPTLSNTFRSLPSIIDNLKDMFTESSYGGDQADIDYYRNMVATYSGQKFPTNEMENNYLKFYENYDKLHRNFYLINPSSSKETLENFLNQSYFLVKDSSNLVQSALNIAQLYKNFLNNQSIRTPIKSSITDSQITTLTTNLTSLNQILNDLFPLKQNIDNYKKSIANYEKDIISQKSTIEQDQIALNDAQRDLTYYFIRAPFDGIVAKLNAKKGDTVSSLTVLATLITKQKIAEVSLNEVDAAKVKIGQKATLTFDAIPDLSITGEVTEIDTVGTVSQGVVSYTVKIAFDTQDERVKPGMSVSASIVTEAKTDVLLVPNAAIKSEGEVNYVEMPAENDLALAKANPNGAALKNPLRRQIVEIGLANEEFTEIKSGLKEGDVVITRTIQPTTATQSQQPSAGLRIPGLNTGGGGFRR